MMEIKGKITGIKYKVLTNETLKILVLSVVEVK